MIMAASLFVIMEHCRIVIKIYLTLIFQLMSRNMRECHLLNAHKYLVYACTASFQIENGGCVMRVYKADSVELVPTKTQRPTKL